MTLSIVDTPLGEPVPAMAPRSARWNPALDAAFFEAPGIAPLIARLRQPGALVVSTGQQPGLFTGPAYAITKALSARGLALSLEARWGRPVIPVYWVPGDDHDLAESGTASWIGTDGSLVSVSLPGRAPDAPLTPMWREPLGPAVEPALRQFESSFADTPARHRITTWLGRHYGPEATVAAAFGSALSELLAPFGVLCLNSAHPIVKREAARLLVAALSSAPVFDRTLEERARELRTSGKDPGVAVGDGATLVFLDGALGRDRLVATPDPRVFQLRRSREELSIEAVERIAAAEPERLSANVLLRPVLESSLLPTVAYCAGPAELRYLALAAPLYEGLGVERQQPVPRWSGLLVEPRVSRVMEKYGITIEELLANGTLEARIARQSFPEGTEAALATLRRSIGEAYAPVIRAATSIDPTLERPADFARRHALFAVDELEKKMLQHARKRESVELAQVTRARTSVRPGGKPQERVISMAGFLARYGETILRDLADHIARWYG